MSAMLMPIAPASVVTSASEPGRSAIGTCSSTSSTSDGMPRRQASPGGARTLQHVEQAVAIAGRDQGAHAGERVDVLVERGDDRVTVRDADVGPDPGMARGDPGHVAEPARREPEQRACSAPRVAATSISVRRRELRDVTHDRHQRVVLLRASPRTTSAPTAPRRACRTAANASASVRSVGVSTQVAPTNRSALGAVEAVLLGAGHRVAAHDSAPRAAGAPLRSSATTGLLTEPTSVTAAAPASSAAVTAAGDLARRAPRRRRDAPSAASAMCGTASSSAPSSFARVAPCRVAVEAPDLEAGAPEREADRAADEAGPDDPRLASLREVVAQSARAVEVHVVEVGRLALRVAVHEDPDDPRHAVIDVELARADAAARRPDRWRALPSPGTRR